MELMINNIPVKVEANDRIVTRLPCRNAEPNMPQGWMPGYVKIYRMIGKTETLIATIEQGE